jgi:hypothetical protein
MMFRIVFWDVLPCKMIVDHFVDHFTRQYIPEDNSEHHTRRRENLKSHTNNYFTYGHTVLPAILTPFLCTAAIRKITVTLFVKLDDILRT